MAVVNTDLTSILITVSNQITLAGIFNYVWMAATTDVFWNVQDDSFCVIAPGRQVREGPSTVGGGRDYVFTKGQFKVAIFLRLDLDEPPQDVSYLTDSSLGILPKVTCVINALEQFSPVDDSGNVLALEPIRLIEQDEVVKLAGVPGWGRIVLTYECNFQQILSCSVTTPILLETGGFILMEG